MHYFSEEYIISLNGYVDHARFYIIRDTDISYQAVSHGITGSARLARNNRNTFEQVSSDRNGNFGFNFAVNYSSLPFPDSYLMDINNYEVSNNFRVTGIQSADNYPSYIAPANLGHTHVIELSTTRNPAGNLELKLRNTLPSWISQTHRDSDADIIGDETGTFGFRYLTDGIISGYSNFSDQQYLAKMNFQLLRSR